MNHSKIQRIYKRFSILTLLTLGLCVVHFGGSQQLDLIFRSARLCRSLCHLFPDDGHTICNFAQFRLPLLCAMAFVFCPSITQKCENFHPCFSI